MNFKELACIDLGECITCLDFSPMGDYFAVGLIDEQVIVWNVPKEGFQNYKEVHRWDGHTMGIVDIKFNENANRLAVSSLDSFIRVWNMDEGQKVSDGIECPPMSNWKISFFSDGKTLVTSGELGKVYVYNVDDPSNKELASYLSNEIFSSAIASSSSDKFVAIGNCSGGIFLYDVHDQWKQFKIDCHHKFIRSLCFTKDELKLITGSDDQKIKVVDLETLKPIITLDGHKGNINCVDCSPDQQNLIVSCSYDKSIKLWDINSKQCLETINYHQDNVWVSKFNNTGKIIGSAAENGTLVFHEKK